MEHFLQDNGRPLMMLSSLVTIEMFRRYKFKIDLVDALIGTITCRCSEPRDHIYSLLGMAAHNGRIQPNYDLSVEQVYMEAATAILVGDQNLRLLSLVSHVARADQDNKPRQVKGLPSWAPDLRYQAENLNNPLVSVTTRYQLFHAGGKIPASSVRISEAANGKLWLHLRGRIIDTIEELAPRLVDMPLPSEKAVAPLKSISARFKMYVRNWLRECQMVAFGTSSATSTIASLSRLSPPADALPGLPRVARPILRCIRPLAASISTKVGTAIGVAVGTHVVNVVVSPWSSDFARTLLCSMTAGRDYVLDDVVEAMQDYASFLEAYFTLGWLLSDEVRDKMLTYAPLIEQGLLGLAPGRNFCRTEEGRLGMLRPGTRKGDVVCVVEGAETPYILRQGDPDRGTWLLIAGDAYVSGVMQGESLEMQRYETVDIVLE